MTEVYVVLTAQVEGNPDVGYDTYHYWDGQSFTDKARAVSHDFNIGVVRKGKLESVWWMDDQIDEEARVLAEITVECDLSRLKDVS